MVVDPQNSVFLDYWQTRDASLRSPVGSKIEGIGRPRVEPSFIPDVVDEMLAILSDRKAWIEKKQSEEAQAAISRMYREGL